MVLVGSADAFFSELERMFGLCRERGAGTVYITLKKVLPGNKQATNSDGTSRGGGGGRREGWLARAKISNKKMRKVSVLVSVCERTLELSAGSLFSPLPFATRVLFVGVRLQLLLFLVFQVPGDILHDKRT